MRRKKTYMVKKCWWTIFFLFVYCIRDIYITTSIVVFWVQF